MRFLNLRLYVTVLLVLTIGFAAIAQQGGGRGGFDTANLDTTCKPCDDFYQYANGGWLAKNPIPPAFSTWGTTSPLRDKNIEVLHQILEEASKNTKAPAGSNEQKIGALYASCMDETAIAAAGTKPLAPGIESVNKLKDARGLPALVADFHTDGIGALFGFSSTQDYKKSTEVIATVGQGGLGLPDRDYYLKTDEKSVAIRDAYVKYVAQMFTLMGDEPAKASAAAQSVMNFETQLAKVSRDRVANRDPVKRYNKMTLAQLQALTPNFKWDSYVKEVKAPKFDAINVVQPEYFQALDKILAAAPLADVKTYMRWKLVNAMAPALPAQFEQAAFDFYSKTLSGTKEMLPRWRRCTTIVDQTLGEALGEVYVKRAFTPEAKARMQQLVKNLIAALKEDLGTISWMGDATRRQAIAKLDAFATKIGYPDRWRDYSTLNITPASFVDNMRRSSQFSTRRQLNKIGRPVDRAEWGMTPPTVNAYNNSLMNEIVFPAGILQPPYFDPQAADDAVNYGAIGAVIGHEMTHGFDDQGRKFDLNGNLTDWWTAEDASNYQQRADCVEKQFSSFKVEEGLNQNGKLVLGESIADLGGLKIAYKAFQKSLEGKPRMEIDGFTPEQRFFLGWAQVWGRNQTPQAMRLQVQTDPHPLGRFRVNGPLSNMPEFAAAFSCQKGDPMVRPENERCQVW
ncbi:MAG TPA: M13 family metallopeptidase [Pyrinomonadaceae bacterium]|jgi:putative endopeptidase|nr:M13 family metallopeptidase [Pyrinomonadaceae bacterium]